MERFQADVDTEHKQLFTAKSVPLSVWSGQEQTVAMGNMNILKCHFSNSTKSCHFQL